MAERPLKVGQRVSVKDKGVEGVVAFIGMTEFAPGKWIGVTLDEAKGKNNGSVQGRSYFQCPDKHGVFVRQTNVTALDEGCTGLSPISPGGNEPPTSPRGSGAATPTSTQLPRPSSSSGSRSSGIPGPKGSRTRLPMPGGGGPTQGRSPSFTNLKPKGRTPGVEAGKIQDSPQSGMQRERSFVEPNFVETMKPPQVVQVQGLTMSPDPHTAHKMSERLEEKVAHLQTQQELSNIKEEADDLKEKLETLKIKRAKDLEKLKEFEKMRIQYDQLIEFKARIMESQAQLQKELQKAKHEAREAIDAKEQHAEEMAELTETVEMATLDKEMAEEKADTLQMELEASKEKIEELQLDLDIVKAEMSEDGGLKEGAAVTNFEVKQLTAQNEKLRETLVKMRDLSAHEKNEIMRLTKDAEESKTELNRLSSENARFKKDNEELEAQISDLQEQVDAALGAEEMVENLTTKTLDLEDRVAALIEEKQDLETLHEMDEELQENLRDTELELREEIDMANGKIREMARTRDAAYEIIHDHETTIKKFRDLMAQMKEQNLDLRAALEKETNKPVHQAALHEIIDFKKMFNETKAHSKAIDMELRKCEVTQANKHISLLSSFMSNSFSARGGDSEAVMVLLLIPRIIWKSSILIAQLKEKFVMPEESTIDKNTLLKGHSVERFAFGGQMMHYLFGLLSTLHQYDYALSTCDPQTFLRLGTMFHEMSAQEKAVDFYIELLRKDQLDENVPLENIEKCLGFFNQMYQSQLSNQKEDHTNRLANCLKVIQSGCECLETEVAVGKSLIQNPNDDSEIAVFFKTSENDIGSMKQIVKSMRRRLPQQEQHPDGKCETKEFSVAYPAPEAQRLEETLKNLTMVVKTFYGFGRMAAQQAGMLPDPASGLSAVKTGELLLSNIDRIFDSSDGLETIRSILQNIIKILGEQNKALQDGDWDIDSNKEREVRKAMIPPVSLRAEAYKSEIKEAESMKYKLENKDLDLKELKRTLKEKSEELSEMQVRKDKAEKKLADANRDAELMREKLQRKLDDTQTLLKRKEKEFEETMDQLQSDIDSLESERGELKNKLKETTKKVLLEGITRGQMAGVASSGPVSIGPSVPAPIKDSPMLLQQNKDLQMALLSLKEDAYRRRGEEMSKRLQAMTPLTIPKKVVASPGTPEKKDESKDDTPSLDHLLVRVGRLRQRVDQALTSAAVVDLTKGHYGQEAMITKALRDKQLKEESDKLRLEVARFMASSKPGGQVDADFCSFPSNQLAKAIKEKDYSVVGRVQLRSGLEKEVKINKVPLIVSHQDLHQIHTKVF